MTLDKKAIEDFQKIYQKEFGVNIEFSEAEKIATSYFVLMASIYKPILKEDFK